jgi:hypothetical protein
VRLQQAKDLPAKRGACNAYADVYTGYLRSIAHRLVLVGWMVAILALGAHGISAARADVQRVTLYADNDYQGRWVMFTSTVPDLRAYGFNDIA